VIGSRHSLKSIELVDYNVRLLDTAGSSSITRVTVEFSDTATGECPRGCGVCVCQGWYICWVAKKYGKNTLF